MSIPTDDSPFVKFLGTGDKDVSGSDQDGIELDPVAPPEPPTDEGGDGGVPYLIERTMQDRHGESFNLSNIHKVGGVSRNFCGGI